MTQEPAITPTVVVDTNIFLSALATPSGAVAQQLGKIFAQAEVIYSADTFAELSVKLQSKWLLDRCNAGDARLFKAFCALEMTEVQVSPSINASRDKADNMFLDLAVTARADMIISGDNDLLQLKFYKGIGHIIPIVRPAAFEAFLPQSGRGIEPRHSRLPGFLAQQSKQRGV